MAEIRLDIDGQRIAVESGATVLEAARQAHIHIPTVCAHEDLPNYGACRMCVVEIEGVRGYPTACTTPAADGMIVRTQGDKLTELRDHILEMMLSGHPSACLVCDHRAECEKHRPQVTKAGRTTRCGFCSHRPTCAIREISLEARTPRLNLPTIYSLHNLERDDPFMDRDHNLCILCGRCWRICEKIHGRPAISINYRGRKAKIGAAFESSYIESGCTFCGACIDICPTGTLTDRFARWYGRPTSAQMSVCTLCPEGCSMRQMFVDGQLVAVEMTGYRREARLCALGRFAYAQLVNAPNRLRAPVIREDGEQIPVDWPEATSAVAGKLAAYRDGSFAAVVGDLATRENRYILQKFTEQVMGGQLIVAPLNDGNGSLVSIGGQIKSGNIKAVLVTGDYLGGEELDAIEYLIVSDFLPSAAAERADAVLPAAIGSELEGTFRNAAGQVKRLGKANDAPGQARPEWRIICELARAMDAAGFDYTAVEEVTEKIAGDAPPPALDAQPRDRLSDLPARSRGHLIADAVPALESIGLPVSEKPVPDGKVDGGFAIIEKTEIVPNFHRLVIEAPAVARHAKPGQFAIVMVTPTSERVPFTLIDWNAERGTITLIVEEVGRSSREMAVLKAGDRVAHVTGPLGLPLPIENYGTVVLGGGCYGIGAIYPIARALKQAGNTVVCVLEACSHYVLYMTDQFEKVCDRVELVTKDGTAGSKGGVQEVFCSLHERGVKIDRFVAIGCTFMMKMVAEKTKELGVPLDVALNPIMVDGTGMCGACRVSISGKTKFACVDGPFFDGHEVDWDELFSRRGAYAKVEIEAMPQQSCELSAGAT